MRVSGGLQMGPPEQAIARSFLGL